MEKQLDSEDVQEYVVKMRRHFHQHPELSFEETETSKFVEKELNEMGLTCRKVGATSLVCDIKGGQNGKIVAIRADMDALPVIEENKIPFASQNRGVMHACGHDSHTAMLLGVAKLLSANRENLKGTVRLLFQAAEEAPPGGAIEIIKAGELKGVSYVLGQHVSSLIPTGTIASYPNRAMANADEFHIKIIGKGGHGSEPQNTIDALVIGAQFVDAAQTVVSRMIPSFNPAVVTVGTFNSGYRYNIIAPYAELSGTVRTFDALIREKVKTSLEKLLAGICAAYGASYEYNFIEGYPVVINNAEINAKVEEIASTILGSKNVLHLDPVMGAEDFAYYLQEVPGTFYFLGTGDDSRGINSPNHSPTFDIDENAMKYGVEILYRSAVRLLSE